MNRTFTTLLSLSLAFSVTLSGLHAKDLPALNTQARLRNETRVKKSAKDDSGASATHGKVSGEVHPHIDKQTLKSALKTFGDQNLQADGRHLKRQRHQARRSPFSRRTNPLYALLGSRAAALLSAQSA